MGLDVSIEQGGKGVLFTFTDILNGQDIFSASKALYTPENLKYLRYQISDLRAVNRIEVSTEEIKALAELDCIAAKKAGGFVIASVVNHDLQESVSRFYRTYTNEGDIVNGVFRTMSSAREWLQEQLHSEKAIQKSLEPV